jgi:putative cell wall-binding protein
LRLPKRLLSGIAAGALGVSGLALALGGATPAGAAATSVTIAGANRYGTAAAVAGAAFPTGSINGIVVLASGENFPDGLTAAGLAGTLNSPILLSPTASLAPETINALGTLKTNTVDVVGGAAAISANVIAQLKGFGYTVNVFAGADRYATASAVAAGMAAIKPLGVFNGLATAILATGANFPDALSSGVGAWTNRLPILLTDPNALSASTSASLTALGIKQVIQMGGTAAITAPVTTAVKAMGINVITIAGADRFATAAAMANLEFSATAPTFGYPANPGFAGAAVLVSGLNFPDALTAVQLAGHQFAPVLLDDAFPAVEGTFLTSFSSIFKLIETVGGSAAVAPADTASAVAAINGAAITGTINALQGATGFTVTYSAAVTASSAGLLSNYRINNIPLAVGAVSYNPATNTAVITGINQGTGLAPAGSLAPGDVVSVVGVTATNATVAVAPFTVTVDSSTPTVTAVYAFPGLNKFAVKFSKSTILNTNGVNGAQAVANYVVTGAGAGPVTFVAASVDVTGLSVEFTTAANLAQGDTITVSPGTAGAIIKDAAGNSVPPFTFTVIPTTVAPAVASVTHIVAPLNSAAETSDNLTIAALATGPANGVSGNTIHVATAVSVCTGLPITTVVTQLASTPAAPAAPNSVTPAITNIKITAGCQAGGGVDTGAQAAVDLNANTTPINGTPFNATFFASGAGAMAGGGAATLVGGKTSLTEIVAFSQPLLPGSINFAATWTSGAPGTALAAQQAATAVNVTAANNVDSSVLPTILAVPFTLAGTSFQLPPATGGSTLSIATGVTLAPTNYAGLAIGAPPVVVAG